VCSWNFATPSGIAVCRAAKGDFLNLFRGLSEQFGRAAFSPHANDLSEIGIWHGISALPVIFSGKLLK
jgi:hypothetical protein